MRFSEIRSKTYKTPSRLARPEREAWKDLILREGCQAAVSLNFYRGDMSEEASYKKVGLFLKAIDRKCLGRKFLEKPDDRIFAVLWPHAVEEKNSGRHFHYHGAIRLPFCEISNDEKQFENLLQSCWARIVPGGQAYVQWGYKLSTATVGPFANYSMSDLNDRTSSRVIVSTMFHPS